MKRYIAESGIYSLIQELSSTSGKNLVPREYLRDGTKYGYYCKIDITLGRNADYHYHFEIYIEADGSIRISGNYTGIPISYNVWRNNPRVLEEKLVEAYRNPAHDAQSDG